ncbi:MAG: glycosyltransferase family 2 protein [Bryobacterales bacterium]|nr:glycosyltransferase family 2 protein [Bryobacterales bacterium]
MASLSYWFLSPSLILAIAGKLRGWDRTVPTPAVDWRRMTVDAVVPAKNEEASIAIALSSLIAQDFPLRRVVVFDDASTDRTSAVVRRYREVTGREIELIAREHSIGKTPALREFCAQTDADAIFILDADSVLVSPNYISRLIEELFRNAGVAAACGEVMPLTEDRIEGLAQGDAGVRTVAAEFFPRARERSPFWKRLLTRLTVLYRAPMYVLLQRTLYDGNLKLFGAQLNPVGCAVAYRTARLRECFDYAGPRIGDNLSDSEDIYIGHFFNWKGYRNFQVLGVRCETTEPPIHRLPRQLFLWSSGFLQSTYYFGALVVSPLRQIKRLIPGGKPAPPENQGPRRIQEQYRAAWGEGITQTEGRPVGWLELMSLLEKVAYPLVLLYLAWFNQEAFWITLGAETLLCMLLILATADPGSRLKYAAMLVPALPIRLMSLGVDLVASVKCLADLTTGNREWRK